MSRDPLYNEDALDGMFEREGFDAVVARSGRNVAYLSGMDFPGTLGRLQDFAHSPRAALVVWPRDGEPTLIAGRIAADLAAESGWIDDRRVFTEYAESPYELAAAELADRGLDAGTVGVERREMGVENWESFRGGLPEADLVDCTDALERVRNVKTPGEIELMERAVEIQDDAFLEVFEGARPGDTERELHARMIGAMTREGADRGHGMMQSDNTTVAYGGEGDVPITDGDLVRTDYVCYYEGYAANLSRMPVMGSPDPEQEERYRAVRDVHYGTIDEIRPGMEAGEVHGAVARGFDDRGLEFTHSHVGHSTGVWWHQEEPMLTPGETRELRAGMVVCLETILDEFWHIQDQILVAEDGADLLSDGFDTGELFVMG